MAKIFISHSAKDDFARSVRDKLVIRLRDMGLKPLVDQEIQPGDRWRPRLDYWMGCCHGAVLLFSREAIDSDWVRKEATILTWRKALHPHLRLIPVLLQNVSCEELRQGYLKTIEVGEVEWIEAGAQTVDGLVEKIAERFLDVSADQDNPDLRNWIEQVTDCLRDVRQQALERVAELLHIEAGDWEGFCDFPVAIAHHLLHRRLEEIEEAVGELLRGMHLASPSRKALCQLLEPLWVEEEAARHILPVTRYAEMERFLAINSGLQETGRFYVHRATCSAQGVPIVKISGIFGEDVLQDALDAFEKACRERFLERKDDRGDTEARREKRMQRSMRWQLPAFLLVPEQAVQREVLAALRHRFPAATFVLLSGRSFPDKDALDLPRLDLVVPELNEDKEDEALSLVDALKGRAGLHDS